MAGKFLTRLITVVFTFVVHQISFSNFNLPWRVHFSDVSAIATAVETLNSFWISLSQTNLSMVQVDLLGRNTGCLSNGLSDVSEHFCDVLGRLLSGKCFESSVVYVFLKLDLLSILRFLVDISELFLLFRSIFLHQKKHHFSETNTTFKNSPCRLRFHRCPRKHVFKERIQKDFPISLMTFWKLRNVGMLSRSSSMPRTLREM